MQVYLSANLIGSENLLRDKPQLPIAIVLPTSYSVYGIIKGRLIGFRFVGITV